MPATLMSAPREVSHDSGGPRDLDTCPACDFKWSSLPAPYPLNGYQPVEHLCPNRKCRNRHWLRLYKEVFGPVTRLDVIDNLPFPGGEDPDRYRALLERIRRPDGHRMFDADQEEACGTMKRLQAVRRQGEPE